MLIIGHRGSRGTKPENSITGIREAIRADADMVEFDIRKTKDGYPVLFHNFHRYRGKGRIDLISRSTYQELKKRTAGTDNPIVTLETALQECYGNIMANIEIKTVAAVSPAVEVVKKIYPTKTKQDLIIFSSFNPLVLLRIRKLLPHAQLAMLHYLNPLGFIAWHRQLKLTAVGFHRLYINQFVLEVARKSDIFTYVYTVNRPEAVKKLTERGIDAIITDYPEKMQKVR